MGTCSVQKIPNKAVVKYMMRLRRHPICIMHQRERTFEKKKLKLVFGLDSKVGKVRSCSEEKQREELKLSRTSDKFMMKILPKTAKRKGEIGARA